MPRKFFNIGALVRTIIFLEIKDFCGDVSLWMPYIKQS